MRQLELSSIFPKVLLGMFKNSYQIHEKQLTGCLELPSRFHKTINYQVYQKQLPGMLELETKFPKTVTRFIKNSYQVTQNRTTMSCETTTRFSKISQQVILKELPGYSTTMFFSNNYEVMMQLTGYLRTTTELFPNSCQVILIQLPCFPRKNHYVFRCSQLITKR